MYALAKPKLKFELFLVDNSKAGSFHKNQSNRVICFADSYDVTSDGSITFFQTAKTNDDKRVKIPVLTYPSGKWEAVSLVDDNNYYPVFNYQGNSFPSPAVSTNKNSNENIDPEDPVPTHIRTVLGSSTGMPNINNNMPGISNNPQEYNKLKNEWISKHIKDYVKQVEAFRVKEFVKFLQKDSTYKQYKPSETDIEWVAASLIKEKLVVARKFSDQIIQKNIGLILPDLMKRQWAGKMAPILEALTDREEAKNANAIDLAVWMANNGFNQ